MGQFSVAVLENIVNTTLDYHTNRGKTYKQTIQDKPLLSLIRGKSKTFPGSKEFITGRAKGDRTPIIQGFKNDDEVGYYNPTNVKKFQYSWFWIHDGISVSMDELSRNGISIKDMNDGMGESTHTDADVIQLVNLLDDKIEDWMEDRDTDYNKMFWQDGTQDATLVPGITSFITNTPTTAAVVGGIDQSSVTWWRNRANVGFSQGSSPNDLTVVNLLQGEFRQLRKFGGKPSKGLAGSDFLTWMEKELRSKGNFTQEGWAKSGAIDMSTADISFKGVQFEYDPTLDDLGKSKYLYLLDPRSIILWELDGEANKKHNPSRPENKYVIYRAMTWAGGLACTQRNANGVYSIT